MRAISSTDVAIALASVNKTLRMVERSSRLGGTFISIEDAYGVIEVADTMAAAKARVSAVRSKIKKAA